MIRRLGYLVLILASCGSEPSTPPTDGGRHDATEDGTGSGSSSSGPADGACPTCWSARRSDLSSSAVALRLHPSGDVIVEGRFQGEIDFAGTKLTTPPSDGGSMYGAFVARLRKTDGTAVWAR